MRFLLIGNPENRRVSYFQRACKNLGLENPLVLSWESLLQTPKILHEYINQCDALRIDSTGENYSVSKLLVEQCGSKYFSEKDYLNGRIGLSVEWYQGWLKILKDIETALPTHFPSMNCPSDLALCFDKFRCQTHLSEANIPTPKILGTIHAAKDVFDLMEAYQSRRVFIKPAHSSSASGVIALEKSRDKICATTSIKIDNSHLYNSLTMQKYHTWEDITQVIDILSEENLFVEQWVPKLTIQGRATDFRVLMIQGSPTHIVARTSKTPITNLHLNNQRGDLNHIKKILGNNVWSRAMKTCQDVATLFPKSHYLAIDLAIGVHGNTIKVIETNAFGDLLPNLLHNNIDTYEAELKSWLDLHT